METATCECGDSDETVTHYLLWCTKFNREREKLRKEVGISGMKVEKLLGYPKFIKGKFAKITLDIHEFAKMTLGFSEIVNMACTHSVAHHGPKPAPLKL